MRLNKKSQSILEYVIILAAVIVVILGVGRMAVTKGTTDTFNSAQTVMTLNSAQFSAKAGNLGSATVK